MLVVNKQNVPTKVDFFSQLSSEAKKLFEELQSHEQLILSHTRSFDQQAAELRLKSGILLSAFKEAVNKGKRKGHYETVVGAIFQDDTGNPTIGKTTRCQRMKVANLKDAANYIHLGWKKLVSISVAANEEYQTIAKFLKTIGFDVNNDEEISGEQFELALKTAVVEHKLKKNRLKAIKKDVVEAAVKRGIQFDQKLMQQLIASKRPDQVLRAKTQYGVSQAPNYASVQEPNIGEIESLMEKLFQHLNHANRREDKNGILDHIPGFIFEDLAHELGLAFSKAGYDGGKFYADVSFVHDI